MPALLTQLGDDPSLAPDDDGELAQGLDALAPQQAVVGGHREGDDRRRRPLLQYGLPQALLGGEAVERLIITTRASDGVLRLGFVPGTRSTWGISVRYPRRRSSPWAVTRSVRLTRPR